MVFHPAYIIYNTAAFKDYKDEQSALAIGGIVLSISLLSLGVTFNGALDTLIPQAFGQGDPRLCRVYLNRQLYLTTFVYMVLAIPLFMVEHFLESMGQSPQVAQMAGTYVKVCIPGVLLYCWQSCYSRYLSGQRITIIPMYANISATVVHIGLVELLMDWLPREDHILAISIASSAQFAVRYLVTVGYVKFCGKFDGPDHQVSFTDPDSLRNWKSQFIFSLQCMSLSVWSWWAMDVFTIIAANIPDSPPEIVNAQHIMRTMTLLTFMIPVGIVVSATILVGNNIGANKVKVGQAYALCCVKAAVMWAAMTILLLITFQDAFISRYTTDPTVRNFILAAYPVMLCYVLFDCVQCVGSGIIRGLGKQGRSSIGTVIGYWAIGMPIACINVFYLDMGIVGLWLGPTTAIAFNFCFYFTIVMRTDWQTVADAVAERRAREKANGTQ
ncbi:hypothetical protein FGO68_gene531 [Halteria grandinella]|uniref:Uncharacterized protein n=1 Tax=Halteria grandinella TaxID=5974 RepID=A0A8J8T266_HALGN|nr:hypothetical protein FGO68_gene531 [Halteria grandinella]